jgi:hypothetical protein
MIYKIMFDLPNLDDKQLMFDSGVTWHLTTTNDRIGKFLAHYEAYKMIKDIAGDIVECGVFKGESITRLAHFREILGSNNSSKIIGFDNFNSIYPDTEYQEDKNVRQHWIDTAGTDSISTSQLKSVFEKHKFENFDFIQGDIVDTVPNYIKQNPGLRVSLLNIDCDFVEPTYTSIKLFWPLIPKGGMILLDNYAGYSPEGHSYFGDTNGIEKFLNELEEKPMIKKFPWVSRPCYIIKN